MKLENKLLQLQSVQPSDKFKKKLHGMVENLPDKRKFYFPLASFQIGIALAVLLVVVGIGSGVVAGVKESRPGTMLYPVKEFIQKKTGDTNDLQQQVVPSLAPTQTLQKLIEATPSAQPTTMQPTPSVSLRGGGSQVNHNSSVENRKNDFSEQTRSKLERFFKNFFHRNNNSSDKHHGK